MGSTAISSKPLKGRRGYRRLVRLLARVFYSGEVPPKEEEEAQNQNKKIQRVSFWVDAHRVWHGCLWTA